MKRTPKATPGGVARRGRPPLEENRAIARAVHYLIAWGFNKRQVLEPVSRAVRKLHPERTIGSAAVEQIWKRERRHARDRIQAGLSDDEAAREVLLGWERYWGANPPPGIHRLAPTVAARRASRPARPPGMTIEQMAAVLIRNGGAPLDIVEHVNSHLEHKYVDVAIGYHLDDSGGHKSGD